MRIPTLTLTLLLLTTAAIAQRTSPPSKAELAQITERGRQLAQYDVAAYCGRGRHTGRYRRVSCPRSEAVGATNYWHKAVRLSC